ncbi:Zn(II)2Cys6 transcription factor domain-containing protein [Aspergillus homomorphus CBS 101889]|uniref:Zn(2)-C6 fungal-type domain-containing protein n=1 Tax=Aspergillus homomorphus (strain CBS 101889) TaxID=1450537 RepID=A0A395I7G3_ASPHC|nr:hypothetical protein BO97DRAFT_175994 [Aspergillus homomorphus CBS 101889]RAL15846.1 hypothetical protein BO97DRAFT_175994 [Aspergillus homomorphus CBS 101889]
MSEGEKRSSSQAGLTEDEHGDSLAIHVDADVNNQNGSGGDDSEVERQLVSALGEVSGNRQKTVLPPPDVGDAGISDEEVHGADGHESSAHEGDDERETTPPPGAEDDDKEENWQPTAQEQTVNAEKRKASDAEGEDEEEEAAAAPLQAPKRKIKRRKKYEAEADHSAAIRARYEKMRESRTPIACDRCKNLRKECTSDIDGCLQCKAAGKECMQTDPVTLRTEKRGDSLRKDELIHILRAENRKLREVIRRLEYQVQLQMRGQINPLGTYQFQPRYRNRTPSPPGSSPWSNATPSSAEKGSGYLSKTGFSPVNNRALTRPGKPTNAEDPKKTGSPSERHANAPKSRATGSEGSGGSGGNSTRFPPAVPAEELEQRLNQGARARINNQFEALMARDPDFNQRAYSGAAGYESPGRPRLNGPGPCQ